MTEFSKSKPSVIPPVWVMNIINAIQQFFFKLSKRMLPPSIWMMSYVENFWLSKGLATAIELNIAEHINEGKNTIEQLADATKTNQDALFRLMRMLCGHEIFKLNKNGIYQLTAYSRVLLEGSDSVKYLVESHLSKTNLDIFSEMRYTLETGKNASEKLFNKDIFSYIQEIPDQLELFNKGMSNTSELFAPVLLSAYNFSSTEHLIDIGGGDGSLLCHILTKYPQLHATLIDNKNVSEHALQSIQKYNLADRMTFFPGNFFESIPEGGNLYILKNILHDWDNNHCVKILKNIAPVMKPGSKLLVIECIIKNDNKYSYGKMLDIMMMLGTQNGKERTLDEFKIIFEKSGFDIHRVIPTIAPFSLIECVKQTKSQ